VVILGESPPKKNSNAEEKMTATVRAPIEVFERCDRCGASAKVGTTFISGELFFCGHHARLLQPHLIASAISIYDPERYMEKRESLG
jgi:hypothetical protein